MELHRRLGVAELQRHSERIAHQHNTFATPSHLLSHEICTDAEILTYVTNFSPATNREKLRAKLTTPRSLS